MGFYEEKLNVTQIKITNTSGSPYVQGQFVLEQGFLGNVTDPLGIANGSDGTIDINPERIVETDQTKAADTFAESSDGTPSPVYFDRTNAEFTDTDGTAFIEAGYIVSGGAADANDVIRFKLLYQAPLEGALPPGSVDTADLADEAVTVDKMEDLAQGSIWSGQALDRPAELAAETDAQILVGDGTDLNSVPVTGDISIDNAGLTAIGADKVLPSMMNETALKTLEKTLTAAEVKTLKSANSDKGMLIVPAPSAGKVIEFVSCQLRYNYDGSNAYTAANGLTFNVEAIAVSGLIAVTFLQGTADRYANVQALSAEIDQDLSAVTAKALYLKEGTSDPTGSGTEADTIKLVVTYRVRDLAV